MTEMNNQQQTEKYIETTSEFVKHFNDYVENPQKNNDEQFVRLMKYMTGVVKNKKPKEVIENREDIPKRRGGIPRRDPDAEPKNKKGCMILNIKKILPRRTEM